VRLNHRLNRLNQYLNHRLNGLKQNFELKKAYIFNERLNRLNERLNRLNERLNANEFEAMPFVFARTRAS
jgi:hypothetical protein